MLNLGGGLGVPVHLDDPELDLTQVDASLRRLRDAHPSVQWWMEPGRYLVAESGVLLTEVRATKHMGRQRFTLVDAGF